MASSIAISFEAENHRVGVRELLSAVFPTTAEADLVERLRADQDLLLGLVAHDATGVVGYIAFSQMRAPFVAVGLAPVAVRADRRNQRIAAKLIDAGIGQLIMLGVEAVFVLGDPGYYSRFGFDANAAVGFRSPYAGAHFMVRTLTSGPLPATTGEVAYARAFDALR